MITQSKCCVSVARKSLNACEPSSSAGFGGMRAGRQHPQVRRRSSCAPPRSASRCRPAGSTARAPAACSKHRCARAACACRRRSAARAGRPAPARSPGCVATSVLPSPGPVLVTTIDRPPSSADENSTLVRIARNASAKFAGHAVVDQRIDAPPCRRAPAPCRGTAARGAPSISSGVLIRLSRYSKKNASPSASSDAAEQRQQQVERLVRARPGRAAPRPRSTMRMLLRLQLARRCRFPWSAASGCRRSGGCSWRRAASTP